MEEIARITVSNEGTVVITCPHCGIKKKVSVSKFRGKKHTVKPRCSCGKSFTTHFEFRRNHRRQTNLLGTYNITSDGDGKGPVAINNLSKGGIGFSVSGIHNIQIGQTAIVDFMLDNRKSTRLSKEVIIKSVAQNHIGCIFTDHQPFEKDFEFYLQS